MSKKMTKSEWQADAKNYDEFKSVFDRLKVLTMSIFKWNGLPESVDEEYLERTLHSDGIVVGFTDPTLGYLALKGAGTQFVNVYGKPTSYIVDGFKYQRIVKTDDCVVIKNNRLSIPTFRTLELYATKIAETQRTIDILLNSHKTPYIMISDEKNIASLRLAFKKIKNNEDHIVVDKGFGLESIKVLQTDAPYIIDKLWDYKRSLYGEAKSFIGIDSVAIDKKERLVVDEANANNDEIDLSIESMLSMRQEAAVELSKLWNTEITVELRKVFLNEDKEEEVVENEEE